MKLVASLLVAALVVASASACSGEDEADALTTDDVEELDADFVPATMLGLAVEPEKTEGLDDVGRSYIGATQLYSLRDGDQLAATLQVGRFNDGVKWASRAFQRRVLNQIGASNPRIATLGEERVYLTTGVKQRLAVWFKDHHLFVLGIREEFARPRTLLREALEVAP